jgi:hypothetical protein
MENGHGEWGLTTAAAAKITIGSKIDQFYLKGSCPKLLLFFPWGQNNSLALCLYFFGIFH